MGCITLEPKVKRRPIWPWRFIMDENNNHYFREGKPFYGSRNGRRPLHLPELTLRAVKFFKNLHNV
jgi:hypothetical protein